MAHFARRSIPSNATRVLSTWLQSTQLYQRCYNSTTYLLHMGHSDPETLPQSRVARGSPEVEAGKREIVVQPLQEHPAALVCQSIQAEVQADQ